MNTSLKETKVLSVIVLDYGTVKSFAICARGVNLIIFQFVLFFHRHFHYDDVIIIMFYMSDTNSTICYHLKALLEMLYIASYCKG